MIVCEKCGSGFTNDFCLAEQELVCPVCKYDNKLKKEQLMTEFSDEKKLKLLEDYVEDHNKRKGFKAWDLVALGTTRTEPSYPVVFIVVSETMDFIYHIVKLTYEKDNHIVETPIEEINKVY
jgi:hypothetical protein